MKTKITFETEDVFKYIRQLLALRGLKPAVENDAEMIKIITAGDDHVEIEVVCMEGTYPETCTLCNHPWGDPLQRKVKVSEVERFDNPPDEDEDDDEDGTSADVMDMTSIRGNSEALKRKGPAVDYTSDTYISGESTRPPKGGR
ncbi:MAG: hypothetical protein CMK74_00680 [Pseudomonadales bacterium]|nr:hypothetical protein [Pseudomonadales bacterium]|tara:strand:- start:178 stop:609 length:432 start_codon:yes stop_codon:yes gene_type:complete